MPTRRGLPARSFIRIAPNARGLSFVLDTGCAAMLSRQYADEYIATSATRINTITAITAQIDQLSCRSSGVRGGMGNAGAIKKEFRGHRSQSRCRGTDSELS